MRAGDRPKWQLIAAAVVGVLWLALFGVAVARTIEAANVEYVATGASSDDGDDGDDELGQSDGEDEPFGTAPSGDPFESDSFESEDPWDSGAIDGDPALRSWMGEPRFSTTSVLVPVGDHFAAFDPATGALVGEGTEGECGHVDWAGPINGPVTDVLVGECDGELVGVSSNAEIIWRRPAHLDRRTRTSEKHLVIQTDPEIFVYDLATGQLVRQVPVSEDSNAVANDTTLFVGGNTGVAAYSMATGEMAWFQKLPTSGLAVAGDQVYVRISQPNQHVVRVNASSGMIEWESNTDTRRLNWSEIVGVSPTAVVAQSTRDNRPLIAFARDTGATMWTFDPIPSEGAIAKVGDQLVTVIDNDDREARILDVVTGQAVAEPGRALYGATSGRTVALVVEEDAYLRLVLTTV